MWGSGQVGFQSFRTRTHRACPCNTSCVNAVFRNTGDVCSRRLTVGAHLHSKRDPRPQRGTRRLYRARPEGLSELREHVDGFWTERLARLEDAAEDPTRRRSRRTDLRTAGPHSRATRGRVRSTRRRRSDGSQVRPGRRAGGGTRGAQGVGINGDLTHRRHSDGPGDGAAYEDDLPDTMACSTATTSTTAEPVSASARPGRR